MSFIEMGARALKRFAQQIAKGRSGEDADNARAFLAKQKAHDGLRPTPADHVNRKDRRKADHKLRQRTRRTGITEREPARYGWAIYNDANNKALQFINHGLLHSLFGKANVWSKPE